ncbi:MAG: hypothetical protein ACRDP7_42625 [Trebonia sp.]
MAVAPLLVTAALIGFGGGHASAAAQASQPTPSQTCILIILCMPSSGSPSPTPSASSPVTAPSGVPSAPATVPSVGQSPTGAPAVSASAGATPSAGSPSPTGSQSPSPSPSPTQPKDATAADGLVVSNVTWAMTVGSATMNGFVYKGNVDLPVAGGGTIQMMEFTVSSMSMSNITTLISENGVTGKETDTAFTASGVTLYATQLTGDIYGIPLPVTFTPTTVLTQLLKVTDLATGTVLPISMTNLTADRAVILAGQAQKTAVAVSD